MILGAVYPMPERVLLALEQVFDSSVRKVVVIEHSRYAKCHLGMRATTRPGRILLAMAGTEFSADPELMLHEYCHVLHQWQPRRLTRTRYLVDSLRHGYQHNRYEREARLLAASELYRLQALLRSA